MIYGSLIIFQDQVLEVNGDTVNGDDIARKLENESQAVGDTGWRKNGGDSIEMAVKEKRHGKTRKKHQDGLMILMILMA